MNKGLIYTGMGMFVFQLIGLGMYYLFKSGIDSDILLGGILIGGFNFISLFMIIWGIAQK